MKLDSWVSVCKVKLEANQTGFIGRFELSPIEIVVYLLDQTNDVLM